MPAFRYSYRVYCAKYSLFKVKLSQRVDDKIVAEGSCNTIDFFVDADGNPLAEEVYKDTEKLHQILVKKNGEWVEIFSEETALRSKAFAGITSDFQSLVILQKDEQSGRIAYYTLGLADGAIKGPLFQRDDADIEGVITDKQRVVLGIRYSGFYPAYKFFDAKRDQRFQDIVKKFPEHSVSLVDQSPDGQYIVVYVEGSSYAGDYFYFAPGKDPVFLTSSRPQIKGDDINPIGKITYSARDNLKIPTLLTIPRGQLNNIKNLPAIILPHGGPEAHDTIGFDWLAQGLASRGYLVVQPQFRGSDGFGWDHVKAGYGQWGKKMQDDLTDGVNFLVKKGMVDPKRICIVGASYGGYAALAGGAFTPDLYQCIVSVNGIGNLKDMLSWDKNTQKRDSWVVRYMRQQFSGDINGTPDLDKISPENFAQNFTAPVLLVHSSRDDRVPIAQSEQMKSALKKAKKTVELIELKGDDHHLSEQVTRQKAMEAIISFVDRQLAQQ